VEVTESQYVTLGKIQVVEKIRTECQLPRTHANKHKPFRLGEVKSQILGESDS